MCYNETFQSKNDPFLMNFSRLRLQIIDKAVFSCKNVTLGKSVAYALCLLKLWYKPYTGHVWDCHNPHGHKPDKIKRRTYGFLVFLPPGTLCIRSFFFGITVERVFHEIETKITLSSTTYWKEEKTRFLFGSRHNLYNWMMHLMKNTVDVENCFYSDP